MKIGILGYGSIGKRHAGNVQTLGHKVNAYDPVGQIDGICTPERAKVIDWADAIIVASPTAHHVIDFHDAAAAGKHVLVEKPFACDGPTDILHNMLKSAHLINKNIIIATGFNLRFHSCVQEVKKLMDKRYIGDPVCASFTVNQLSSKPVYLRDGIIRNWLSHEIDLAHFLLGDGTVESCVAPIDELGYDSKEAFLGMKFDNVRDKVFVQGDYYTNPEQRFFWIEGTDASLYVNLIRREVYAKHKKDNVPKMIFQGNDSFDENYIEEMRAFIGSIHAEEHNPWLATAEDGIRAHATVMEARKKAGLE